MRTTTVKSEATTFAMTAKGSNDMLDTVKRLREAGKIDGYSINRNGEKFATGDTILGLRVGTDWAWFVAE